MSNESYSVCVVGAGVTGVFASLLFARLNFRVTVVDTAEDSPLSRKNIPSADNVMLTQKSMNALKEVDALGLVSASSAVISNIVLHTMNIHIVKRASPSTDRVLWSLPRYELHSILLDLANSKGVKFCYGKILVDCRDDGTCTFQEFDSFTTKEHFDLVIGADGTHSSVRRALLASHNLDYSQQFVPYGYRTFAIPPITKRITAPPVTATGEAQVRFENDFSIEDAGESLTVWESDDCLLSMLPGRNHSLVATLVAPLSKLTLDIVYDSLNDEVQSYFGYFFPALALYTPDLSSFVGPLVEMRTSPCQLGKVVLIGSAAHSVIPLLGPSTGVNIALWDALMLYRTIQKRVVRNTHGFSAAMGTDAPLTTDAHSATLSIPLREVLSVPELQHCLPTFAQSQQRDMDALAGVFNKYLQRLAQPRGSILQRLRCGFEFALEKLFPTCFVPLYERLAFLDEPYEVSVEAGERQSAYVDAIGAVTVATVGASLWVLLSCAVRVYGAWKDTPV